jgi:hypothetical protein
MGRLLTSLMMLLLLLCGMANRVSAKALYPENIASGGLGQSGWESCWGLGPQTLETQWKNELFPAWIASDVCYGPNVYTYVRQNPWTMFDPLGLEAFNAEVYGNMKRFDRLLMRSDQPLVNPATLPSPLVRASSLLFFAEENHDIVGRSNFKALQDGVQAGLTWAERASCSIPICGNASNGELLPESSIQSGSSFAGKVYANVVDPTLRDMGPANLKTRTALQTMGYDLSKITNADVAQAGKLVRSWEGTAQITQSLAEVAVKDLKPLISGRDIQEQTQITVNYLRRGPDSFWSRIREERNLSSDELTAWKANPDTFVDSQGNKPKPIDPGKMDQDRHKQVEELTDEK